MSGAERPTLTRGARASCLVIQLQPVGLPHPVRIVVDKCVAKLLFVEFYWHVEGTIVQLFKLRFLLGCLCPLTAAVGPGSCPHLRTPWVPYLDQSRTVLEL